MSSLFNSWPALSLPGVGLGLVSGVGQLFFCIYILCLMSPVGLSVNFVLVCFFNDHSFLFLFPQFIYSISFSDWLFYSVLSSVGYTYRSWGRSFFRSGASTIGWVVRGLTGSGHFASMLYFSFFGSVLLGCFNVWLISLIFQVFMFSGPVGRLVLVSSVWFTTSDRRELLLVCQVQGLVISCYLSFPDIQFYIFPHDAERHTGVG